MTDTDITWDEPAIDAWYREREAVDVPATHVVTVTATARIPIVIPPWHADAADAIGAELAVAWADQFTEQSHPALEYADAHPAFDVLHADERPSLHVTGHHTATAAEQAATDEGVTA